MRPGVPGRNVERLKVPGAALAAFLALGGFDQVVAGLEERYGADEPTEEVYDESRAKDVEADPTVNVRGALELVSQYQNAEEYEKPKDVETFAEELQNVLNDTAFHQDIDGQFTVNFAAASADTYVCLIELPSGALAGELYYDVTSGTYTFSLDPEINGRVSAETGIMINPFDTVQEDDIPLLMGDVLELEKWVRDNMVIGPKQFAKFRLNRVLSGNSLLKIET